MGRLLSVNVGLPRDIVWQGRTVHTGIWKTPGDIPRVETSIGQVWEISKSYAGIGSGRGTRTPDPRIMIPVL